MKTNIQHKGMWWSWNETCDRCGETIHDEQSRTTGEPDTKEADFCLDCLRYLMDNDISYSEAFKEYKSK